MIDMKKVLDAWLLISFEKLMDWGMDGIGEVKDIVVEERKLQF